MTGQPTNDDNNPLMKLKIASDHLWNAAARALEAGVSRVTVAEAISEPGRVLTDRAGRFAPSGLQLDRGNRGRFADRLTRQPADAGSPRSRSEVTRQY